MTRLTDASPPQEREQVARALAAEAAKLDPVARALLRGELIERFGFAALLAGAIVRTCR